MNATQGKHGGLSLALPPEEINLGRLVRDVERDFTLAECFASANQCAITPACSLKTILASALGAFLAVLDSHTLADILPESQREEICELLAIG